MTSVECQQCSECPTWVCALGRRQEHPGRWNRSRLRRRRSGLRGTICRCRHRRPVTRRARPRNLRQRRPRGSRRCRGEAGERGQGSSSPGPRPEPPPRRGGSGCRREPKSAAGKSGRAAPLCGAGRPARNCVRAGPTSTGARARPFRGRAVTGPLPLILGPRHLCPHPLPQSRSAPPRSSSQLPGLRGLRAGQGDAASHGLAPGTGEGGPRGAHTLLRSPSRLARSARSCVPVGDARYLAGSWSQVPGPSLGAAGPQTLSTFARAGQGPRVCGRRLAPRALRWQVLSC